MKNVNLLTAFNCLTSVKVGNVIQGTSFINGHGSIITGTVNKITIGRRFGATIIEYFLNEHKNTVSITRYGIPVKTINKYLSISI